MHQNKGNIGSQSRTFVTSGRERTTMENRQLFYFTRIVALGSFTKAAAELRIAQPSLGQQIRNLEEELGTSLLVRHSRGVKPTEAGAILFQHASKILDDVRRAKEAVLTMSNNPKGVVTVGMTPGITDLLAARLVERCNQDCPAIQLNIEQDLSVRLVKRVASDETLAFALVSDMECSDSRSLHSIPIATEQLYLVGSPKLSKGLTDPVEFSRLQSVKLTMLGIGLPNRPRGLKFELEIEARRQGLSLTFAHEMQSVTAVQDLIERNIGFGILPYGAVRRRVEQGSLRAFRIIKPDVCREIRLVRSPTRLLSNADGEVMKNMLGLAMEETRKEDSVLQRIGRSAGRLSADLRELKVVAEAAMLGR